MSTTREAARDAAEYARAQMFYGEGAGNRRKLITSAVNYKIDHVPGYFEAFTKAMKNQDYVKHAKAARKERRTKDARKFVGKNVRAIARGDRSNLSTPLLVIAVGGYLAHEAGLDKKAYEYGQEKYREVKHYIKRKRAEHSLEKSSEWSSQ